MASDKIIKMCQAVDEFSVDEYFDRAVLKNMGVASSALAVIPQIVARGYLKIEGDPTARPQSFKRVGSLVEAVNGGKLDALYPQYKKEGSVSRVPKEPVQPQEQWFDVDPFAVLEGLKPEEFGTLVAKYIELKNIAIKPIQERLDVALQQLRIVNTERHNDAADMELKINLLKQELKDERETVMNLRSQLSTESERHARKEIPVRTVLVRVGNGNLHKESGSSGNVASSVRVHGKPFIGDHPAKPVVDHKK